MNVNKLIKDTLKKFNYPVEQDLYTGENDTYFVFTYAAEQAVYFADNKPVKERAEMYISLYLPLSINYFNLKTKIRIALVDAGFSYPSVEQITDVEANKRHLIFNCEIDGKIEMED